MIKKFGQNNQNCDLKKKKKKKKKKFIVNKIYIIVKYNLLTEILKSWFFFSNLFFVEVVYIPKLVWHQNLTHCNLQLTHCWVSSVSVLIQSDMSSLLADNFIVLWLSGLWKCKKKIWTNLQIHFWVTVRHRSVIIHTPKCCRRLIVVSV